MSFASLLRGSRAAEVGARLPARKQYKYEKRQVEANIEHGERAALFIQSEYGQERGTLLLNKLAARGNGSQPRFPRHPETVDSDDSAPSEDDAAKDRCLPYGVWRKFMVEELAILPSRAKRMHLLRSLKFYLQRKRAGAITRASMRGMRAAASCRNSGGARNGQKSAGLRFALLQFFVDDVQRLSTRADSRMLMNKARELRNILLDDNWSEMDLPKLEGAAGRQWFRRWRLQYGIVKKVVGMRLKVSWKKVKSRVAVLLGNIFRLRAFWELCHPDVPMRFLSIDQKPSWFSNSGLCKTFAKKGCSAPTVKEIFAHTRQRYTILTSVPSWGHDDPDLPPKVAILFKAAPHGKVITELRKSNRLEPWMKVQVQEQGSYRSEDVVEALDWMLPNAANSTESIVLLLDWYQGHLTEEVAELVRRKGHVLLFHGGGTTPFTQINDTHLHALLSSLLIETEIQWAHDERRHLLSLGQNKTPAMTRESILSIVKTAWLSIDHARVAEIGYKQTGPTMQLRGPAPVEDVFQDWLRVVMELETSSTPTELGTSLRDHAVTFVREGFDSGKWTA